MAPVPVPFEDRIGPPDANGCRPWMGARCRGYGLAWLGGRHRYAHRVAWEREHGPIPVGMNVLHQCDNPSCCEVGHLFLGTHADNMADMVAKGRQRWLEGEAHHAAKLTKAAVRAIRASRDTGTVLAARYGVNPTTISRVRRGANWKTA